MKRISIFLITITLLAILTSCGNTLFNAGGIFVSEITATNLPSDGDYALAGAFFDVTWANDNLTETSADGTVTWTFDPALEVPVGSGDFKIVQSGTWSFAVDGGFSDPHDNIVIFDDADLVVDNGTYVLEWDASLDVDEGLTITAAEEE